MIHEDLCHSLSLKRLKEIFHESLNEYLRRSKTLGWDPVHQPIDLYYYLQTISKLTYSKELLE